MKKTRAFKASVPKTAIPRASQQDVFRLEKIRKSEWSGVAIDDYDLSKLLECCTPSVEGKPFELRPCIIRREDMTAIRNRRQVSDKTRREQLVASDPEYEQILRNNNIPLYFYDLYTTKNVFVMTIININPKPEDIIDFVFSPLVDEDEEEDDVGSSSYGPSMGNVYADPPMELPMMGNNNVPIMSNNGNNNNPAAAAFMFTSSAAPQYMPFVFSHSTDSTQSHQHQAVVEEIKEEEVKKSESPKGTVLGAPPTRKSGRKQKDQTGDFI